jgi:radical SAM superfamily enzyme YgiQ (UPF0313 family)
MTFHVPIKDVTNMKILLVKPPANRHAVVPPIGLVYIAAYLKSKIENISIDIIDCVKEGYNHNTFSKYVCENRPNIVGISAFSMEIESALRCCEIVKEINNEIITVIGGPHVSCAPENVLSNKYVDFIFRNEAEIGFYEFIKKLITKDDISKVPNLGYKENGCMKFSEIEYPKDLDNLPFPDYELMKLVEYPKTYMTKNSPYAPIITSRGCPFSCTYCAAPKMSGKNFRFRTPENVIAEIKFYKERYNIKEFQIWDDNFTLNKKRAHHFCDLLIKEDIRLPWWCPNGLRVETLDEELIKKMKIAGLYAIAIGIESGSEKIQKDMKKNLNFEKITKVINLGNKYKIRMQGFFILGYPTERREDILKTIEFSKKLRLKRASFLLFQPLVGSEIYDSLDKDGKLKNINLNNTEFSKPSVIPDGMSLQELISLHRKAILEFYLRPKILIRFILENLSIDQLKEIWDMVRKYILKKG